MDKIHKILEGFCKKRYPNMNLKVEVRENKKKIKGDYYSTLAFHLMPHMDMSVYEIGIWVKDEVQNSLQNYTIEVANNGYINFFLKKEEYVDILKKIRDLDIKKNDIEFLNTEHMRNIKYVYSRINTILHILSLDNIHGDTDNFNEENIRMQEKLILDKIVKLFNFVNKNKQYKEYSYNTLVDLCNVFCKYEENVIIKYLDMKSLENFIVLLESISILIEYIVRM